MALLTGLFAFRAPSTRAPEKVSSMSQYPSDSSGISEQNTLSERRRRTFSRVTASLPLTLLPGARHPELRRLGGGAGVENPKSFLSGHRRPQVSLSSLGSSLLLLLVSPSSLLLRKEERASSFHPRPCPGNTNGRWVWNGEARSESAEGEGYNWGGKSYLVMVTLKLPAGRESSPG